MALIIPLFPDKHDSSWNEWGYSLQVTRSYRELIEAKMRLPKNKVSPIDEAFIKWLAEDSEANHPLKWIRKLIELIQLYRTSSVQSITLSYLIARVKAAPAWTLLSLKKWLCETAEVEGLDAISWDAYPFILEYLRVVTITDEDWV